MHKVHVHNPFGLLLLATVLLISTSGCKRRESALDRLVAPAPESSESVRKDTSTSVTESPRSADASPTNRTINEDRSTVGGGPESNETSTNHATGEGLESKAPVPSDEKGEGRDDSGPTRQTLGRVSVLAPRPMTETDRTDDKVTLAHDAPGIRMRLSALRIPDGVSPQAFIDSTIASWYGRRVTERRSVAVGSLRGVEISAELPPKPGASFVRSTKARFVTVDGVLYIAAASTDKSQADRIGNVPDLFVLTLRVDPAS